MKKTITLISMLFTGVSLAQSNVADFESFTLTPSSAYSNTNSIPFQTSNAWFEHKWNTSFNFWSGGFAYTNIKDSSTAGFSNLYGVKALNGYNNSNIYVVGQNGGVIKLIAPANSVSGFYITNTTYAYKSMLLGDAFAKKFGGASGNDPDFFKVTVRGYLNGSMKADSAEFYLADYRFSNNSMDYIVNNWQWFNTSSLGAVDSIKFFMYSSDNGTFGMNTPAFFAIDNFTSSQVAGINKISNIQHITTYPNPVVNMLTIENKSTDKVAFKLVNSLGSIILEGYLESGKNELNMEHMARGVNFIYLYQDDKVTVHKIIKE